MTERNDSPDVLSSSADEIAPGVEATVHCHECATDVPQSHRFCGHCGARLSPSASGSKQWLLSLIDAEGEVESSAAVIPGTQTIGSSAEADIRIEGDRAVSPRHIMVRLRDGELSLEDKGTRNGLFAPLVENQSIEHNALIRAGGQLFRFQLIERLGVEPVVPRPHPSFGPATKVWGRLLRYNRHGQVAAARLLDRPAFSVGRREGDWRLSKARTMSGLHFQIEYKPSESGGGALINDLKSRNGTFVEVTGAVQITDKDEFLIGDRLVRLNQVTLAEYHDAIGTADDLEIHEVQAIDESEVSEEETLVAIPEDIVEAALEDSIPPVFGNDSKPSQDEKPAPEQVQEPLAEPLTTPPTEADQIEQPVGDDAHIETIEAVDANEIIETTEGENTAQADNERTAKDDPPPTASQTPTEIDDLSAVDHDLATHIDDDEPGEWAKAALSDFQDLDD